MKKICCFTGTRAEYGLLRPLLAEIKNDRALRLQLVVSGMHLSPEFGLTYRAIEADGFPIDEKVETLLSSDTPVGVAKSLGLGVMGLAEAFARLAPDLVVLLGDRFETFAAATAALLARIPIAHLHGGETTEGAYDEAFRHAITKMSSLHFTATEQYRQRVIQLGEQPATVFNVGAIGLDNIRQLPLLSKDELGSALDFGWGKINVLVTFHPVTLEKATAAAQFQQLLDALDQLADLKIIFTKANADTDGRIINQLLDEYVAANPHKATAFASLGQCRYLSALRCVDAVLGNSSSGIIEAPSFGVPTVNIGDRQKGRLRAASIIDCEPTTAAILQACQTAFSEAFKKKARTAENPYEQKNTARQIKDHLQRANVSNTMKSFYDLERQAEGRR